MENKEVTKILAGIDAELQRPVVDIKTAIQEAIVAGRMSAEEGNLCIESYEHTFNPTPSLEDEVGHYVLHGELTMEEAYKLLVHEALKHPDF